METKPRSTLAGVTKEFFSPDLSQPGKIISKCRITKSIPILDIKIRIKHRLVENGYYIHTSSLYTARIRQIVWMYPAYPDLTARDEFSTILVPLLNHNVKEKIYVKAIPEFITIPSQKASANEY